MPAPDIGYSTRYYMRRVWAHLVEMSGVAPHHTSGSQPSMSRGSHFPPHRGSLEEHSMHERGEYCFNFFFLNPFPYIEVIKFFRLQKIFFYCPLIGIISKVNYDSLK